MRLKQDVYLRLQSRLIHECESVHSMRQQMKELSSAYNKFVDLDRRLQESEKRMSYIARLMGPARFSETAHAGNATCLREMFESDSFAETQHKKLALWRAVREYLREAPGKSTVGEIEEFLVWIGLGDVTRQAIESALKLHNDWFKVTKKGHQRYVELR